MRYMMAGKSMVVPGKIKRYPHHGKVGRKNPNPTVNRTDATTA
jgi:hypothetical protein